ncbi:DNA/RNA non-specific endonuclease [Glutamicibacter soli]|uniref:Endonuclease n=1 Tax=Glutamicibacter soli TaxID=453836 RepID=A0A365YA24_9MICC|nr:DNA/RNA non-specific endonuclease [Glutamicibacter soli]RBL98882.1 DNA/RNA non-specific endonuclease [Glutamicibacter soli]
MSLNPTAKPANESAGFNPHFLTTIIGLPTPNAELADDLVQLDGSPVIDYTHFSLALSRSRKFARWVGWNIDGAQMQLLPRTGINFSKDRRIPAEDQAGDDLYTENRLDRGHLARRADLTWGPNAEAQQANRDSFYFTNITPQMEDFNQSRQAGIWGRLENALYEDVELDDLRCSVFAGPVLRDEDQPYRGYQLPAEYWKIILFEQAGRFTARAFLLTQNLDRLQVLMALDEFRVYQITVSEVEERTGLVFPTPVHDADDLTLTHSSSRNPLSDTSDITW